MPLRGRQLCNQEAVSEIQEDIGAYTTATDTITVITKVETARVISLLTESMCCSP